MSSKLCPNSPKLASRVFPLADYFMNDSSLDPRQRELAVLILMKRLNCEYGFVRHITLAKQVGLTQEQIDNVGSYQTSALFNDNDKLILRYADDLTTKGRVDDDLFKSVETNWPEKHDRADRGYVFLEYDGAQPQCVAGGVGTLGAVTVRLLNTARDKMAAVGQPPPQKFLTELPFRHPLPLATQSQKITSLQGTAHSLSDTSGWPHCHASAGHILRFRVIVTN